MMNSMETGSLAAAQEYDVVCIGGAFSGAATALLLMRERPDLRVLIVERSTEFDRKVGEATSEIAGCFLTRVLRLSPYLSRNHLLKQGLRMWFTQPGNECIGQCGEIGAKYQVRLATYQLDRAELDQHILDVAVKAGATLLRPAKVRNLTLGGLGQNTMEVLLGGGEVVPIRAKYVIDASGRQCLIAKQRETWRVTEGHPTTSIWARYRNVRDLDSYETASRYQEMVDESYVNRSMATNHLTGYGWWCWIIPLRNGDYSAGLVYDERLFTPPEGKNLGERLLKHLLSNPIGREMFGEAQQVEHDIRSYRNLPYHNREICGDGFGCVGDAAGFMDPLYSQGLDYCSHTAYGISKMALKALDGELKPEEITQYNQDYLQSYMSWYHALYKDKYHYLGDIDFMWPAFLLDIGCYYLGPVRFVYSQPDMEYRQLPYNGPVGAGFAKFMAFYNRRLSHLAQRRLAAGTYGKNNLNNRKLICQGFSIDHKLLRLMRIGIMAWMKLEFQNLWLRPKPVKATAASPATASPMPSPASAGTQA